MAECGTLEVVKEDVYKLVGSKRVVQSRLDIRHSTRSLRSERENDDKETRIVVVGKDCRENKELQKALATLDLEVKESETGLEYVQDASQYDTVFVLSRFEGEVYHKLHKAEARIMGPCVVIRCAKNKEPLPYNTRPQYCAAMQGLIICFTGYKKRDELCYLVDLVHHMAGSVRKDISGKVTHLVANGTGGDKYRFAVSYGTPIMSQDWIHRVWAERDQTDAQANSEKMMQYTVAPFYQCCLSFLGFSAEEKKHMEELTIENGGLFAAVGDDDCTHLVVDDQTVKDLPLDITPPRYVVRSEWFWGCIQMEACADEHIYTFQKLNTPNNIFTPGGSMGGCSKSRKRKRLKENLAQLAAEGDLDSPHFSCKRRSSEFGGLSMSPNSFLDASNTPDKSLQSENHEVREKPSANTKTSPRLQVVMELLQTEKNYVGILHTIINTFKAQIEKPDQYNGPLLAPQDIKLIFGKIPAIYDVHCKMQDELTSIVENWREEQLVGEVIARHADALVKAYPPFVNFFDQTKETIKKCDKSNPRFHAFLKVCQSKPECGRQTLEELLIRPVQRLPSIMLLMNDILKHTNKASKNNPDIKSLEKAISVLKEVMTHINEDRRRTECQVALFDIMNDIDNCPATLLSSHRKFVTRIDVVELGDTLCGRGAPLALFLFTDSIVLCKRRTKVLNTMKSPANHKTPQKAYKHLEMMPLSFIKRVLDVIESEGECRQFQDSRSSFGLICKNTTEFKERLYSFMMDSDEMSKKEFLTVLCKNMANALCRADYENLMVSVDGNELQINTTDLGTNTLSKAFRFGKRVSRAFSFNKTPGRLKRAVSSVTHAFSSPFVGTPSSDLRGKRLASSIDLTDMTSPLGSLHGSVAYYDDSDTCSLGAYSLKDLE